MTLLHLPLLSPVRPAGDPGDVPLAVPHVLQPVPGVGVSVGEHVDPPPLPQARPPGPGVVVRGAAEHSPALRDLADAHLKDTDDSGDLIDDSGDVTDLTSPE